ncbi:hypothetical protein [uncultured Gammaproteobacteria bacterium]|nr:hypothetical protein [uncultured Gammaproteobacteria bacterium]
MKVFGREFNSRHLHQILIFLPLKIPLNALQLSILSYPLNDKNTIFLINTHVMADMDEYIDFDIIKNL